MKQPKLFSRLGSGSLAAILVVATLVPSVVSNTVHAFPSGGQVQSRSIQISSSTSGASSTTYKVKFTSASSYTIKGIVVQICEGSDTPIIGDSNCDSPTGFSWGAPTVSLVSGISGGTWVSNASASGNILKLEDNATGNALTAGTTVVEFDVTTVTNPTDTDLTAAGNQVGTFYGRIVTYDDATAAGEWDNYVAGTEGSTNAIDYGGVALSLANAITVTAKVQEALTFCVFTDAADLCENIATPGTDVTLGNGNGVLADYTIDYNDSSAKFNVGSNAQNGVTIRIKAYNLCRAADVVNDCEDADVTNTITAIGSSCTADSAVETVEQFGLQIGTLGTGVTSADYDCAADNHNFNTTELTSTYGDVLATTSGPTGELASNTNIEFAAKAATTTEAGIYTTDINFIATGSY